MHTGGRRDLKETCETDVSDSKSQVGVNFDIDKSCGV